MSFAVRQAGFYYFVRNCSFVFRLLRGVLLGGFLILATAAELYYNAGGGQ